MLKYYFKGHFSMQRWYFSIENSVKPQMQCLPVMAWRRSKMNSNEALATLTTFQASCEHCRAFQTSIQMHPRWVGCYITTSPVFIWCVFSLPFLMSGCCVLTSQTGSPFPCLYAVMSKCSGSLTCSGTLVTAFCRRTLIFRVFGRAAKDLAVSHLVAVNRWKKLSATSGTSATQKKLKQFVFEWSCQYQASSQMIIGSLV